MASAGTFEQQRTFVTQLAYRMLGSVQDAEDVAQETYLRWHQSGEPELQEPRAWFARTTTRICIDRLRQEASRPEYPGEWLPEPWVHADTERSELDDTLSMALLVTIRKLSPTERAVFLLHDVFGYGYETVSQMLDLRPDNCRQQAARARRNLRARPPRQRDPDREQQLADAFFVALREGNLGALERLLQQEVVMRSDGGGKVAAVHYPLEGRDAVVRFMDRMFVRTRMLANARIIPCWHNEAPGHLIYGKHGIESAFQFECVDGYIANVHIQRNPEKLRRLRG